MKYHTSFLSYLFHRFSCRLKSSIDGIIYFHKETIEKIYDDLSGHFWAVLILTILPMLAIIGIYVWGAVNPYSWWTISIKYISFLIIFYFWGMYFCAIGNGLYRDYKQSQIDEQQRVMNELS